MNKTINNVVKGIVFLVLFFSFSMTAKAGEAKMELDTAVWGAEEFVISLYEGKTQVVGNYEKREWQKISYGSQEYTLIGVSKAMNYRIKASSGKLPKGLVATERITLLSQTHREYDLSNVSREMSVDVVDGRFSDIWQWSAYQILPDGKSAVFFPKDFAFTAKQELFLNDQKFAELLITIKPPQGLIEWSVVRPNEGAVAQK